LRKYIWITDEDDESQAALNHKHTRNLPYEESIRKKHARYADEWDKVTILGYEPGNKLKISTYIQTKKFNQAGE